MCGENEVCVRKLLFKNTLDINDRPIRTVLEKQKILPVRYWSLIIEGSIVLINCRTRNKEARQEKHSINPSERFITKDLQSTLSRRFTCGSRTIVDIH